MMNKRSLGTEYEKLAQAYLSKQGVWIQEKNFRVRSGEIDLIGKDGKTLVFFEVKFRSSAMYGLPQVAVNAKKQKQICMVSDYYCCFHRIPESVPKRYDVIAICENEITWIKNAFSYCM